MKSSNLALRLDLQTPMTETRQPSLQLVKTRAGSKTTRRPRTSLSFRTLRFRGDGFKLFRVN